MCRERRSDNWQKVSGIRTNLNVPLGLVFSENCLITGSKRTMVSSVTFFNVLYYLHKIMIFFSYWVNFLSINWQIFQESNILSVAGLADKNWFYPKANTRGHSNNKWHSKDCPGGGGAFDKMSIIILLLFQNIVSNAFFKWKLCLTARQGFKIHFLYYTWS